MTIAVRRLTDTDVDEAARQRALAFGIPLDDETRERTNTLIAAGELWGAAEGSDPGARLLAICGLSAHDHWFGGRRVACQHIASVAVPPEHRGRGVASALMREAVRLGADEGLGLSLLFPATTRLYRKLGWEHAGSYTRYRVAAWQAMPVGPRAAAMRPATDDDWPAIHACHERASERTTAVAVRGDDVWELRRGATYRYVLDGDDPGTVDAYLLFDHQRVPDDWRFTLEIHDWAATTPAGMRAVVGLVASHGSLGRDATFLGGRPEPWSLLIGEQDVTVDGAMYWMARGLDLARAVDQRGFPPGLSGAAMLTVQDPLLPATAGPWRLEIKDGRGTLTHAPGDGAGNVRLDVRAVGPLYTGFRDPPQLALAGLVDGPPDELAFLSAAFAGPPPTLLDFF